MTEVDPDPNEPDSQGGSALGGRPVPAGGDPTDGGRHGGIGEAPSVAADEPDDGSAFPVGGGHVQEERDAPPASDPGPDA